MRSITIYSLLLFSLLHGMVAQSETVDGPIWIDVRTQAEYDRGFLPGATLIPFDRIEEGVAGLEVPANTPIYLYCTVGGRAEKARKRLQAQGCTNVTNVGGLADARQFAADNAPQD